MDGPTNTAHVRTRIRNIECKTRLYTFFVCVRVCFCVCVRHARFGVTTHGFIMLFKLTHVSAHVCACVCICKRERAIAANLERWSLNARLYSCVSVSFCLHSALTICTIILHTMLLSGTLTQHSKHMANEWVLCRDYVRCVSIILKSKRLHKRHGAPCNMNYARQKSAFAGDYWVGYSIKRFGGLCTRIEQRAPKTRAYWTPITHRVGWWPLLACFFLYSIACAALRAIVCVRYSAPTIVVFLLYGHMKLCLGHLDLLGILIYTSN